MIRAVVFDLGKVLIDWDPRHVLDEVAERDGRDVDELIAAIDVDEIQRQLDLGVPHDHVWARWRRTHTEERDLVDHYFGQWPRTVAGAVDDVVAILDELRATDVGLYALSNFSGELFRQARPRFGFLDWFDGLVISGDEGVIKPDPRIYGVLVERHGLDPSSTVFIDDRADNVDGARAAGLVGLRFTTAHELRADLIALGLDIAPAPHPTGGPRQRSDQASSDR